MGLLSEGTPLSWHPSQPHRARVKSDGVLQFLNVFKAAKNFRDHDLKWGDEVEYLLIHVDDETETATLSLRAPQLLDVLQQAEHSQPKGSSVPVLWRPEYPKWMIEGTPGVPYRCYASDLVNVERNMVLRRHEIAKLLAPGEVVLSLTNFPRTGCGVFTTPPTIPFGPASRSFFLSDDIINPHPRFKTLTRNIRQRRGKKVNISLPLFIDERTNINQPFIPDDDDHLALLGQASENFVREEPQKDNAFMSMEEGLRKSMGDNIVMDASGFGMGCSCLQVTIQGRDLEESRYLYDQLAVMAPLMLALTAASPIFRGLLADTDARWDTISAAMDDRSEEESESMRVPKSRYSSIDCYISSREKCKPETYNDIPIPIDKSVYDRLIEGGVDHMLAQHIAHLYIREPLVIYKEKLDQDNQVSTDHFENIQSTNWNTVRFKPPPPNTDIGWRTEFRSMEVGLTDFENAAYSVFTVILSRVILAFNLNFYIPMSKVDVNMNTAHLRGAAKSQSFYFRKNVFRTSGGSGFLCDCGHIHNASLVGGQSECIDIDNFSSRPDGESSGSDSDSEPFELMTLDEIFNGKPFCTNGQVAGFAFPGLIPLMRGYLNALKIDNLTRTRLCTYLDFVSERASGALCTNAEFIRNFVRQHASYEMDSIVDEQICYDLVKTLEGITTGEIPAPELLGRFQAEHMRGEVETPHTMLARMQRKLEGLEAGLLHGSSLPRSALLETIETIAREKFYHRRCCESS